MNWLTSVFKNPLEAQITTPPSDLSTAVAGSLAAGRLEPRHVASILFDLAQRGYFTIEQTTEDVMLHRLDANETDLLLFEQLVLRDLFGNYQSVAFARLSPTLNALLGAMEDFIDGERRSAQQANRRAKRAWRQFARYLRGNAPKARDLYGTYFAHAVALGAIEAWCAQFEQVAAQPRWYATPNPTQHAAELLRLAQVVEQAMAQQAQPFMLPGVPFAFGARVGR